MSDMHSYRGWLPLQRVVRKGEKAEFYAVCPSDPRITVALFSEEQTEPVSDEVDETWTLVPASERPKRERPKAPAGDKIHVDYDSSERQVSIWVGSSKPGITSMRRSNFWFSSTARRWIAKRDDIAAVVQAFHDSGKFRIQLTIDGEPREIGDAGEILPLATPQAA